MVFLKFLIANFVYIKEKNTTFALLFELRTNNRLSLIQQSQCDGELIIILI